jgi:hypothetical protein
VPDHRAHATRAMAVEFECRPVASRMTCAAMLAAIDECAAMTDAYIGYFPRYLPARNAFTTNCPTLGRRIELACTATRTGTK